MTDVPKTPLSPKVIASTVAALLAPAAIAILGYLQSDEGRTVFVSWPPVLVVALMALLPALATFLAGYFKADPLRYHPTPEPLPPVDA
jgi:hypothetical protein